VAALAAMCALFVFCNAAVLHHCCRVYVSWPGSCCCSSLLSFGSSGLFVPLLLLLLQLQLQHVLYAAYWLQQF
jgi:hypothetical protein